MLIGITKSFAKSFAVNKHGNQKYGKMCYAYHLQNVVDKIQSRNVWCNIHKMVDMQLTYVCAYLHDVVEDTKTTIEDIEVIFGEDVAEIVDILTHKDSDSYNKYLERVATNKIATIIKIADSMTNLEHSTMEMDTDRMSKYSYNIAFLTAALKNAKQ